MPASFDVGFSIPSKPIDTSVLPAIGQTVNSTQNNVLNFLTSQANEIQSTTEGTQNAVNGFLSNKLYKTADTVDKYQNKVVDHIIGQSANLMTSAAIAGIPPVNPYDLQGVLPPPTSNPLAPNEIPPQFPITQSAPITNTGSPNSALWTICINCATRTVGVVPNPIEYYSVNRILPPTGWIYYETMNCAASDVPRNVNAGGLRWLNAACDGSKPKGGR
jgi:hypothetical protein